MGNGRSPTHPAPTPLFCVQLASLPLGFSFVNGKNFHFLCYGQLTMPRLRQPLHRLWVDLAIQNGRFLLYNDHMNSRRFHLFLMLLTLLYFLFFGLQIVQLS